MKRIRPVSALTAGLADYLATAIAADWDGFGSHRSGASLRELRGCLTRNQHGLCAYCEIEVKPLPGQSQIEHVVPRSEPARGKAKALDITNLVACRLGGSKRKSGSSRRPHRSGLSCGQAKAELSNPDFVDPRTLPTAPSLLSVGYDGRLEADAAACQSAGWRPARIRQTVAVSNLNTERLRRARERRWNDLVETSGRLEDTEQMETWVRSVLTPDKDDRLAAFFTTSRCYFAPLAERILAESPQGWI